MREEIRELDERLTRLEEKIDRILAYVEIRNDAAALENERVTALAINIAANIMTDSIDPEFRQMIIDKLNK